MRIKSNSSLLCALSIIVLLAVILGCSEEDIPTEPEPPSDVTPPAAVTNLQAYNATDSSITLRWMAPGDDDTIGTATEYDIRFSTTMISDASWTSASQSLDEPPPKAAGSTEHFTVTGLLPSITYHIAIKTADEIHNWSALSNIASWRTEDLADTISPGAVTDLTAVDSTAYSVKLQWTAPGDDGATGTADRYDIRYSTSLITDGNWYIALYAGVHFPSEAGTQDSFTVDGLLPDTDYFFALKTADEEPNWSPLSNVIRARTPRGHAWWPLGPGMDNMVFALTEHNGRLIAGGMFHSAGGIVANYIAAWDGSSWSPLGSGTSSTVYALTVYDGKLIAGGGFTSAGGVAVNCVASWDGSSWSPLGTGTSGMNNFIFALTIYDGQLIAGGGFSSAGGVSTNNIAAWDGDTWSPVGTGISGLTSFVITLLVHNDRLIAGGWFTEAGGVSANHIAAWDGSSWAPLGLGTNDDLTALAVYNGYLIAGGMFTTAGGGSANCIAAWDGNSWSPLGTGVNAYIGSLAIYNGQLIAGGAFTSAGSASASRIAAWDGSSWTTLGPGMGGIDPAVRALTVYNGRLIAGGIFTTAGYKNSNYIAAWFQ